MPFPASDVSDPTVSTPSFRGRRSLILWHTVHMDPRFGTDNIFAPPTLATSFLSPSVELSPSSSTQFSTPSQASGIVQLDLCWPPTRAVDQGLHLIASGAASPRDTIWRTMDGRTERAKVYSGRKGVQGRMGQTTTVRGRNPCMLGIQPRC